MVKYNLVVENPESTVVSSYEAPDRSDSGYQSEADLERHFIEQLTKQAYEYLPIHSEKELIANLRLQLEKLNNYQFSDNEWDRFFKDSISNPNLSIEEKTTIIQEDYIQLLTKDDGTKQNIYLIDKKSIHNNYLQVINQYSTDAGAHSNRYDVTILVNGLPLVHVELKRRGVDIKEAFNQINRYQRDSFWAGCGLFEFVQVFVISNGTYTKYYSNTTRTSHIKEQSKSSAGKTKRTSHSFEFTSWWADAENRPITDLEGFAKTFFAKHTILNILTRYCVFTTDKLLLVMRPYQIVATERVLNKITIAHNYKYFGSIKAGGYIWHTTGSGKTLTSFKTAQLACELPFIDKVLFVVDRKDLDYQTMKEYDKFEKGAANSNTSTTILKKQLENPDARIIITTIQKLSVFIKKNKEHAAFTQNIVIIFDECHRSQFGEMHTAITKNFKRYYLFGFTGTPIFAANALSGGNPRLRTTEQAFGDRLHTYTIVNAIADKNVLPFRVDYVSTMKKEEDIKDEKVWDIDRERALAAPERISNIVTYILNNFNRKTKRNDKSYTFRALTNISEVASARHRDKVQEIRNAIRLSGFNSIFAVASIDVAKLYYAEFKRQMEERSSIERLKIATIYSFGMNDDLEDGLLDENSEDTNGLDQSARDFLDAAIADYNEMFGTSYDTSSDKFQNYYKDVSLRMKNREIDILIVVNMFLTGFDATTLNTLWVDKNLRMHGLLQAYSRTNRILNSIKTFGNIVCFRNLEHATNQSIALFGDKEAKGLVLMRTFAEYFNGYNDGKKDIKGYEELANTLIETYPIGEQIISEKAKKDFISLYGTILRLRNILVTFDEFASVDMLSDRDIQDYNSIYNQLYEEFRGKNSGDSENVNDDIVFEMELIKQVEINIDYILMLIAKYHESNCVDKQIIVDIRRAIDSSPDLRNKKDLIEQFIDSLTPESNVDSDWGTFVEAKRKEALDRIISEEGLKNEETIQFMDNSFRDGYIQTQGTDITRILPPINPFAPDDEYAKKKQTVIDKLVAFFNKFWDICSR